MAGAIPTSSVKVSRSWYTARLFLVIVSSESELGAGLSLHLNWSMLSLPQHPRINMDKGTVLSKARLSISRRGRARTRSWVVATVFSFAGYTAVSGSGKTLECPYGRFPLHHDPFHFLPCTENSIPPPLDRGTDYVWKASEQVLERFSRSLETCVSLRESGSLVRWLRPSLRAQLKVKYVVCQSLRTPTYTRLRTR